MVTWDVFACIVISFLFMLVPVPVCFIRLWRRKGLPVNSFFSGAAVFIVFYLVVRFYLLNSLGGSSVLALLLSALVVEGGRFVGLAVLPEKEDRDNGSVKTGLSLALGYITAAFLLINAFEMGMNFVYAGALEGWGILADFLNRFPAESVDRVQVMISSTPSYTYLLEALSLYLAVPVQVLLTFLVFQFYRAKSEVLNRILWLAAAVFLDFLYFQIGTIASSPGWALHLLFLFFTGGASLVVLIRIWGEELRGTLGAS